MEEQTNELSKDNYRFCVDCGKKISKKAKSCPNCGRPTDDPVKKSEENRFIITLLLCWFLGVFGVHRFYTGHTTIGIIQLLTLGGCGIWTLVDFIIIIVGNFKDSEGVPIKAS